MPAGKNSVDLACETAVDEKEAKAPALTMNLTAPQVTDTDITLMFTFGQERKDQTS